MFYLLLFTEMIIYDYYNNIILQHLGGSVKFFDFVTENETSIPHKMPPELTTMHGHGFADYYLMRAFVSAVATGDRSLIQSGPEDSLRGHQAVFAAEVSRKKGGIMMEVDI